MVVYQPLISAATKKCRLLCKQLLALFFIGLFLSTVYAYPSRYPRVKSVKPTKPTIVTTTKNPCQIDLVDDVKSSHQRYMDAINISNWIIDFRNNSTLSLVVFDSKNLFIYTRKKIYLDDFREVLGDQITSKAACPRADDLPDGLSFYIFDVAIDEDAYGLQPFQFVYPNSENHAVIKYKLSNLLGKYLFVNQRRDSKLEADEVSRTIVHEAIHLFGQDRLVLMEPNFDQEISSRYYLDNLRKTNIQFHGIIKNQICYSYEVLKLRIQNKNFNYKKREGALLLSKLLRLNKDKKVNYGIDDIESYWYLLEGIPEYLDHQILLTQSPDRLLEIYRTSCEEKDDKLEYFYPNLVGAAIFHSYEMLGSPKKKELDLISGFEDIKTWSHRLDSYVIKDKNNKKFRSNFLKKNKKIRR